MRYGLPYQGSKSKLAERVVALLPEAEHLYDIFAGGCAVTHCALMQTGGLIGKWRHIHANDITDMPRLFRDAASGKYADERRWISREDFRRLKATDPYIRSVWSFGNEGLHYMYSRKLEPYKKALHEMLFAETVQQRRMLYHTVIKELLPLLGKTSTKSLQCQENLQRLGRLQSLQYQESLQRLQRLQRLESLERLERLESLEITQSDYRDVEILPGSVIYADPPYIGTTGYGKATFDHAAFYDWCERQDAPLFISEYWMPEDRFTCIAEWGRTSTLGATNNSRVTERIYRPNTQLT